MKHIYLAFALMFLLLSACNNLSDKKDKEENKSVENAASSIVPQLSQDYYTMDEDHPAICGEVKDGSLWLTFHKDQILPFGVVDEDSYRLSDEPIHVEGLKGMPKNFIIADIGQDYNPILCVLTSEGKMQILNLWNTVSMGDIEATEIPMEDIVGFKAAPGGAWQDEDGSTYYEYTTIYGIDSKGGEHEVPLYMLDNDLEFVDNFKGSDVVYQLHLSDAWKMQYQNN